MEKFIKLTDKINGCERLLNISHIKEVEVDKSPNSKGGCKVCFDNGDFSFYKENIKTVKKKLEIE